MKPKHFILTLLAVFVSITASAYEWTDENGTVWNFTTSGNNATLYKGNYTACVSGTIPENLTIPSTVYIEATGYTVTSIGDYAFNGCSSLTSINIPDGVMAIGDWAFGHCQSLASITIPDGVTSIGSYAFYGCSSLTTINIPGGVTTIESNTFGWCTSMTSITIPDGVTAIESEAFYQCTDLEIINLLAQTPPSISNNNNLYDLAIIRVPAGSKSAYRAADKWSDFATRIIGDSEWNDATVNVTALDAGSGIQQAIGEANIEDVYSLKVNGSINGYDFLILRQKMPALRHLDLSDANVVANDFVYYTGQHSEDNVLGACAFDNTNLRSIKLPRSITSIGNYAFNQCSYLSDVTFYDGLTTIGTRAFYYCRIKDLDLPNSLLAINDYAFQYNNIKHLVLPSSLIYIGWNSFEYNGQLQSIVLPEGIQTIKGSAFQHCSNIQSVTVKTPIPITIPDGTFPTTISSATLYVPELATSKEKYYWANGWSSFLKHEEYHPEYENFYLTDDYEVGDGKDQFAGVGDKAPNADLQPESGFIKEGEQDTQKLGEVDQDITGNGTGASIIAKDNGSTTGNLDINKLNIKVTVRANTWYFFCFPYDVTIANCTYPGDYVWKEYQGLLRATAGKGWKTVEGETLKAFDGYAFRSSAAGTLVVSFNHPTFGGNRPKPLAEHACDNAQHASWNFVGNPYSSYYDFRDADFTAPVTLWNGSSYVAYRPGDDECHLRPYEAFFVQKPNGTTEIAFDADRRETYQQSEKTKANRTAARRAKGIDPQRRLINLEIRSGEEQTDRTRIVLNKEAKHAYELECDAAKFLSTDAAAQLYSVEGSVQMAINERPQDGDIRLGYTAKEAGRLSISASRMDLPMVLVDTQLGVTFDLTLGAYDFGTQAGAFDGRFLLRPSGEATAINGLTAKTGVCLGTQDGGIAIGGAEGKTIRVYTAGGALAATHEGNGFIALARGIYVVSVDGESAKVSVK